MTPKEALEFAKKNEARQLDLRFTDLPGVQQHVSYPIDQLDESSFEEGFGFDGSSIRGWAAINESDMLLIPDPSTAMMDPFTEVPTLVMTCGVIDPITRQHYERDPRWIAQKAEMYLHTTGIGDTAYFGPEAEFFIFDNIYFDPTPATTLSIRTKAAGTPGARKTISATARVTRKATSLCRPWITTTISAPRW
jgi:glutamine synthetase